MIKSKPCGRCISKFILPEIRRLLVYFKNKNKTETGTGSKARNNKKFYFTLTAQPIIVKAPQSASLSFWSYR
jgi:hypothetical protein